MNRWYRVLLPVVAVVALLFGSVLPAGATSAGSYITSTSCLASYSSTTISGAPATSVSISGNCSTISAVMYRTACAKNGGVYFGSWAILGSTGPFACGDSTYAWFGAQIKTWQYAGSPAPVLNCWRPTAFVPNPGWDMGHAYC